MIVKHLVLIFIKFSNVAAKELFVLLLVTLYSESKITQKQKNKRIEVKLAFFFDEKLMKNITHNVIKHAIFLTL